MYRHLFGPVPSRRLGMSLGIDLVPHKVCSFNCVYCECGRTTRLTVERAEYVPVDEVLAELEHYLAHHDEPDTLTFSGAGEPTLNSRLGEVLRYLLERRRKARIAVLTNASLLDDPGVRAALAPADLVVPSLDAAREAAFRRLDRPSPRVRMATYLEGLEAFRAEQHGAMWLEIVILPGYNDSPEDLAALRDAAARLAPERIQLNTLDRPGTEADLQPATREGLERIAADWDLPGVEIIAKAPPSERTPGFRTDPEAAVRQAIARRPCTAEDLARLLGASVAEAEAVLERLRGSGELVSEAQERGTFYRLAQPR